MVHAHQHGPQALHISMKRPGRRLICEWYLQKNLFPYSGYTIRSCSIAPLGGYVIR